MASTDMTVADVSVRGIVPPSVTLAEPARPRLLVLGTSLAIAAIAMGYIGLLGHYIAERAAVVQSGSRWLPEGVNIPLTQPNFQGLTLAFSIVTIWWAVSSIKHNDRFYTLVAYALSVVFAVAFIAQTAFLLEIMGADLVAEGVDGERTVLIYAIIGTHLVMMVAAIVYAVAMAFRTLAGEYSSRDYEGVLASAIFWTATVVLYGVMWYVVYITK